MNQEINIKGHRRIPDIINGTPEDKYTKVKNNILRSPEYSAVEVKVLGIICSNKDGWVSWLSTILGMMQEGEASVKKAMQGLEEKGHIKRLRYKEAKTGQYVGSFMSSSMEPGQHNIEETIKMLEENDYIVTDKLGRNVRKIQGVENPQGGNRLGGDPVGGDGGTKKNNSKKNKDKKNKKNYSNGQEKNSETVTIEDSKKEEDCKTQDGNDPSLRSGSQTVTDSNFSDIKNEDGKEDSNIEEEDGNVEEEDGNGREDGNLKKVLNSLSPSTIEYKLLSNFTDAAYRKRQYLSATKKNAGNPDAFKRLSNRLKHKEGEMSAASNLYQKMPDKTRSIIDKYVELEYVTWDKKTINDYDSWWCMRVLEYFTLMPHFIHWTKLKEAQRDYYINKCQEDMKNYKCKKPAKKKQDTSYEEGLLEGV